MIKKIDGKWVIYSHSGDKKLGEYDSKKAAEKRLKQIEYFKYLKEKLKHRELNKDKK